METTFKKKVKGVVMENIFDNSGSELFMVKYYANLTIKDDEEFIEDKSYRYEITLRHPEGTDAITLFNNAVKQIS